MKGPAYCPGQGLGGGAAYYRDDPRQPSMSETWPAYRHVRRLVIALFFALGLGALLLYFECAIRILRHENCALHNWVPPILLRARGHAYKPVPYAYNRDSVLHN